MLTKLQRHWFLSRMAERPAPLKWFLPTFRSEHANAPPLSGLGPESCAKGILELVSDQLVVVMAGEERRPDAPAIIRRFLDGTLEPGVALAMTDSGGREWEALASPEWDRFVRYEVELSAEPSDNRFQGLLASTNLDVLMAYLGWWEQLESAQIEWDSVKWRTHSAYPLTYWKNLTNVTEVSFTGETLNQQQAWFAWLQAWVGHRSTWFIDAWRMPGWVGETEG